MKQQSGIALISSLLILTVVFFLGISGIFLTQSNLRVAENVRSNAVAKGNAETGLEAAYVILANYHEQNGEFPTSFSLSGNGGYELSGYRYDDDDQVMVSVLGTTPGGAEYVAEALLNMTQVEPEVDPVFTTGLVSESVVRVTSNASLFLEAGVHGNAGFDLGGTFEECLVRDPMGDCLVSQPLDLSDLPISLSDVDGTCKLKTYGCANPGDFAAAPVTVDPNYEGRRDNARDLNGDGIVTASDCSGAFGAASNVMSNAVVCSSGSVSLTNAVLTDVTIIAEDDISLSGTSTLTGTTLISLGGAVDIGGGTFEGVRIFSEDSLGFSGNNSSYLWEGSNTVATAGSITFNGSNKHSNVVNGVLQDDGSLAIGLVLIAEGDITFNGRNSQSQDYYTVWITGGSFTQNGRSEVYGTVSARDTLRFNGHFFIDAGLDIVNDDLATASNPVVTIASRR